jgi:putative transposase
MAVAESAIREPTAVWFPHVCQQIASRIISCDLRHVARPKRFFVEGLSWHVTQRGVDRSPIFRASTDQEVFQTILTHECGERGLRIHAYALMGNHIHLLATPESETSLPDTMQALGRRYVPFFNQRYSRTGGLWEGRYKAALVHDERYWLTCMRYVELNPVRAGIVARPEEYRWSSYAHHASGAPDPLVSDHPLYVGLGISPEVRQLAWQRICEQVITSEHLKAIRKSIRSGIVIAYRVFPTIAAI